MKHDSVRAVLFDAGNTLMHLDYGFIAGVLERHGHRHTLLQIRTAEYGAKAAVDHCFGGDRPRGRPTSATS